MNWKKILSIILSFVVLFSIIPLYNWKIVHASIAHEPFIENEYEDVTILNNGIEGDITVEEAREILSDIYGPQYAYLYDNSFERRNGEKFYYFRIRWFVEDHYSTITGVFLSFDGKVCVEGEYSGTRIMAYSNINKITSEDDEDALEAYNKMLSADTLAFYTDLNSGEIINIDASDCKFAIAYVDNDKVPELIVDAGGAEGTFHATGVYNFFTYKDGNIKCVKNTGDDFTYYEKTGIYSKSYTGMGASTYWYYDMYADWNVFTHAYYMGEDGMDEYYTIEKYYDGDNQEISEAKYQQLVKHYCGEEKEIRPDYYENTVENRKKILENFENNAQKSIVVFTTEKSMKVKTGKSMWLGFGLLNEDSGFLDDEWKKMAVVVSDPTVIALSDYTKTEYGYSLEITGKKQGATNITISDTENGINTIITVFVQDDYAHTYSYAIDNIASFYPNNTFEGNIETNIYDLNGLYVNKYQCTKSADTYNVSFDVYNSKYYSGAVDIYDENGMWLGYEEINKYSDISSLWDTGEQAYFLVSDMIKGKMLTYEQASFSKYTHIDIDVPEGGYFTISNNVSESPGTFFVNALEILFEGAYTAFDLFTSGGTKESALTSFKKEAKKSFATRLIEARNEGLKNNVKKQSQKIMLNGLKSEIKKITKKFTQKGLKDILQSTDDEYSEMANLVENVLNSLDISWKHLFKSVTGIGESYFTKFAGPAGIALKGCFALSSSTNKILMATQMSASTEKPYVMVYSSIDKDYINPYGIMVNTNGNIDAESILQVFRISNSDVIEVLLDSSNPLEIHELYNICFVKDDTLVQPNGKVMVQIPIPQGMKGNTCKIYRQETNGNWTILDARVQGDYLVFETDHFSFYALIGESDNLVITSLPKKTNYTDGEILDTDGLVLDLNGQLITEGYICEPTVLSGNGKQFVKVIYGHSTTEFEVNVEKIDTPTATPIPTATPTVEPTVTPEATPTIAPTEVPSATPSVNPGDTPTVTPTTTVTPSVDEVYGDNTSKKLTVGSIITSKKTKAVYKISSIGKNKTVEYVKSAKKNVITIKIPATVKLKGKTYKVTSIGKKAFKNNKKLKTLTIGKNVTTIKANAFSNCPSLTMVTIPAKVKKIGKQAFYKCKNLRYILVKSDKLTAKNVGSNAFGEGATNLRVKTDKTKWRLYAQIFMEKGMSGKALFIIDPVKLVI